MRAILSGLTISWSMRCSMAATASGLPVMRTRPLSNMAKSFAPVSSDSRCAVTPSVNAYVISVKDNVRVVSGKISRVTLNANVVRTPADQPAHLDRAQLCPRQVHTATRRADECYVCVSCSSAQDVPRSTDAAPAPGAAAAAAEATAAASYFLTFFVALSGLSR